MNLFTKDGQQITGVKADDSPFPPGPTGDSSYIWWNIKAGTDPAVIPDMIIGVLKKVNLLNKDAIYRTDKLINNAGDVSVIGDVEVKLDTSQNEGSFDEVIKINKTRSDLVFIIGGHDSASECNYYKLRVQATMSQDLLDKARPVLDPNYTPPPDLPAEPEKTELISIATQDGAQKALVKIDNAIIIKDSIRAHLGALQNRVENTVSNISMQAENLQAAESRISDVDIATEMTSFVRNNILSQSAVAMLSQANSIPQMAMQLIQS